MLLRHRLGPVTALNLLSGSVVRRDQQQIHQRLLIRKTGLGKSFAFLI